MPEYVETMADEEDTEHQVLTALAKDDPYVFIVASGDGGDGFSLRVAVGGGLADTATVRRLLEKTIAALPES